MQWLLAPFQPSWRPLVLVGWQLLVPLGGALAQTEPTPQRVEITGSGAADDRRDANASKSVVLRADIERHGDRTLAQVLARAPGVSVSGAGAQAKDIALRGLGAGYTQILINGDPVPPGFSLDSLSADLIERIEILRSPTADLSAQGIAGTINIILRQVRPAAQAATKRSVKLGASTYAGLGSGSMAYEQSGRLAALGYSLSTSTNLERDRWPSVVRLNVDRLDARPDYAHLYTTIENATRTTVALLPRITWRSEDSQSSFTWDAMLQAQRFDYFGSATREALFGTPPVFSRDTFAIVTDAVQARSGLSWRTQPTANLRTELRASASSHRREFGANYDGFDGNGQLLARRVTSELNDRLGLVHGKASLGWFDAHSLSLGGEHQRGYRSESRVQRESSSRAYPVLDLDEDYAATVIRSAVFLQDEWDISNQMAGYAGVRWESLRTRTWGVGLSPVEQSASVLSPTFQWILKSPTTKGDQVRVSLGRTYKPPTARELVPRRWVVADNGPTSPNFQGNPGLAPELAWSLDAAIERFASDHYFVGLSTYLRRISGVIVTSVYQDAGGTWVSTPVNMGDAAVVGGQVESRAKLAKLVDQGPDVDVNASVGVNRSRVTAVPGPGNRLAQQPQVQSSLGADWRATPALTMGASFQYERHVWTRTLPSTSLRNLNKRNLDVYALWRLNPSLQLRASLTNALGADAGTTTTYADTAQIQQRQLVIQGFRTFRVLAEFAL